MENAPDVHHVNETSNHEQAQPTSPAIEISKSPRRSRPWSTEGYQALLAPSPSFDETKTSKDDIYLPPSQPVTPRRLSHPPRGLSLQMPPRDISSTSTAALIKRVPLSPKLDPADSYVSPSSALPRRSRGMDFSRACTNLHHSTLAEQSSPDSSPVVGARGGIMIPPRKGTHNSTNTSHVPDSPGMLPSSLWSNGDKAGVSSSLGTASMMEYLSGSSTSEDDEMLGHDEEEDTIHMTPQIWRSSSGSTNLFGPAILSSPGRDGLSAFSPAAAKLMSFQRARTSQRRSRKSSSSTSAHSTFPGSGPASPPPLLKSIESSMSGEPHRDPLKREIESRRESLSLGTCELELSDEDQSVEGKSRISPQEDTSVPVPATPSDERRNVIRRAVTRRGNLLVCLPAPSV